jgi:hypothetical protein
MEIHVAPAGHVLDPDALGAPDGVQAGRRDGLVQEGGAVSRQQLTRVRVEVLALPGARRALWLTSPSLWLGLTPLVGCMAVR